MRIRSEKLRENQYREGTRSLESRNGWKTHCRTHMGAGEAGNS